MKSADVVDILQVVVPSMLGVIPAVLLYLQNKASSNRESADRQLERAADEQRRAHELESRRLDLDQQKDAEAIRAAEEDRKRVRDRYLRFLTAAQNVGLHWKGQARMQATFKVSEEDRAELASSYEDALLAAPAEVCAKMVEVKDYLDSLSTGRDINTRYTLLQTALGGLREAIRNDLESGSS